MSRNEGRKRKDHRSHGDARKKFTSVVDESRKRKLKDKIEKNLRIVEAIGDDEELEFELDMSGENLCVYDLRFIAGTIGEAMETVIATLDESDSESEIELRSISLCDNDFRGGAEQLVALIYSRKTIESADLSSCKLSSLDCLKIVRDLNGHKLCHLNLSGNYAINPEHEDRIAECYRENSELTKLILPRCSEKLKKEIEEISREKMGLPPSTDVFPRQEAAHLASTNRPKGTTQTF